MAPRYVAPGPIAVNRSYLNGGGAGGGGGGGGYFQAHDQTAELQNRLQNTGLEGMIQGDLSNQRFVHQSQLQAQAADLDAWQYSQKVTEQEQLQLRQDQNAIAAIDADPTLTPLEKTQAKLRIKTRVDWVGERQKRDLMQAQVEQAQAHAQAYMGQADLDRRKTLFDAQSMSGQSNFEIDKNHLPDLEEYMRDAFPWLKPEDPMYQQEMTKEAVRNRYGRSYVIDPKTGGKVADPYELERMKHWWSATGGADAGGPGGIGSARSSTGAGKGGAEDENVKSMAQLHKDAFDAASKAAKDGGNFDETYKKFIAGHQELVGPLTPEAKKQKVEEMHQKAIGINEVDKSELDQMTNINPQEKQYAQNILNDLGKLIQKYPPGKPKSEAINARMNALQEQYKAFKTALVQRAAYLTPDTGAGTKQPPAGGVSVLGGLSPVMGQQTQEDATKAITWPLRKIFGE